jgi:hypothetical protein
MRRSVALVIVLAISIAAMLLAAKPAEKSHPKLTVIYYYLPG